MATDDVKLAPADMLRDFRCAVGVMMTPETAPRVVALVTRAAFDASRSSGTAKDFYKRRRPYLVNKGAVCQPAEQLKTSYDYPSGHATLGWTWATLLVQMVPDRATAIMARGRAFGESRIVCGVHNASAVDPGRTTASATLAAVQSDPVFLADFDAARSELAALRGNPRTPRPAEQACAAERGLIAERVY